MGPAPPPIPLSLRLALGVVWVVALLAWAFVRDAANPAGVLLEGLLQSVAVATGAVFLGASLLERLQRAAWRRRTEVHAVDGLARFLEALQAVARLGVEIGAGPGSLAARASQVVDLPWSEERAAELQAIEEDVRRQLGQREPDATDTGRSRSRVDPRVSRAVLQRVAATRPPLRDAIDALERVAAELEAYLDEPFGSQLRKRVIAFRNDTRDVLGLAPPKAGGTDLSAIVAEFTALAGIAASSKLLAGIPEIATAADQAMTALRRRLTDHQLQAALDRKLQVGREMAREIEANRTADEALQALLDETDRVIADFAAANDGLEEDVARLEQSDDPRQREFAAHARAQIRSIGAELRGAFGEYEDSGST